MNLRQAYLGMIKAFPGGWDAMAAAMGMTRDALENRIYERRSQGVLVDVALQMQAFSDTTMFAQAVAAISGGTFVKLPQGEEIDREDLLAKFNHLYAEVGLLSQRYNEYTQDNEIDKRERADLIAIGDDISKSTQELLALVFRTFCQHAQDAQSDDVR